MANNIAFLFSDVPTPLSINFPDGTIPNVLKHAPKFYIDNPIVLQRQYLKQNGRLNQRRKKEIKDSVKRAEENALETSVKLFDWLDGLEPQPTTEIIATYKKSEDIESRITSTLAQMGQAATTMAEIRNLMEDLRKKSTVSFHLPSPEDRIPCSLDVERECLFQLRKDNKSASLEAGARSYLQLSLWQA